MANRPYPPPTDSSTGALYGDPFADRPRRTQFQEPGRQYDSTTSLQRPFQSTASLTGEMNSQTSVYSDEDYVEKLPLTSGQNVGHVGGFYPPGYVSSVLEVFCFLCVLTLEICISLRRLGNPDDDSDERSVSLASSSSTNGAWRRRQTIKRGITRRVKLTNGNFITEYPVPTPVHSAIEPKYAQTKTSEFTLVITYLDNFFCCMAEYTLADT
jgi:chitin synthase